MGKNKVKDFNSNNTLDDISNYCGIYEIVTTSGGKYIGMCSTSFYDRWRGHLNHLSKNKHYNQALQRAFHKYGKDNLNFNIIYSYKIGEIDKSELCRLEQNYWDHCKLKNQKLYNGRPIGGSTEHSLETRIKISENMIRNNPDRFNKTLHLTKNIDKILEYANSSITMENAAIELNCSYGVLNKFVKDNNIQWLNNKQYLRKFYNEVFGNNLKLVEELANDLSISKIEGSKLLRIPLSNFNKLLEEYKINWSGVGVKPNSIKFLAAIEDIKSGVTDVQYLSSKHSLTRENIYYLKKRFNKGLL